MHYTARCLGYPSDSTRRRGSGLGMQPAVTTCAGLVRRSRAGPHRLWSMQLRPRLRGSTPRPCGSTLHSLRPCGSTLRQCGSPLSHLAGVGQCPLAIGLGCLVWLLASVLDRRPVSPLPSISARSGAGSGWHGRRQIAYSTVYPEGLAPGGAGLRPCAISWAVTVFV
jgi:hypothetical protein